MIEHSGSRRTTAARRTGRTASRTCRSSSTPPRASCARPRSRPTRRCCPIASRRTRRAGGRPGSEGATDPLTAFLAHAALEAGDTQAAEGRPALQLMTVHSAKGLEFHTVFVTGLEEGPVPAREQPQRARRARGGAAADVRRDHARAPAAVPHASRRPGCCTARRATTSESRFLDEMPTRARAVAVAAAAARRSTSTTTRMGRALRHGAAPQATPPAPAWRIGQSVRHAKFGVGVIIDAEGRGSDARVQVNFRDCGRQVAGARVREARGGIAGRYDVQRVTLRGPGDSGASVSPAWKMSR